MTKTHAGSHALTAFSTAPRWCPHKRAVALSRRKKGAAPAKVASTHTKGGALLCNDVTEWLQPKGRAFRAFLVPRPQGEREIQEYVDKLANSGAFGRDQQAEEKIDLACGITKQRLALDVSKKAHSLTAFAVKHGLPKDIAQRIQQDFGQVAMVLADLVPTAKQMLLKLDIIGEHSCPAWHRDYYVGRAIISYNSSGTQFVSNDNVDFDHLGHGGLCKDIIHDESQIFSADVGDVLFMKGLHYPGTSNGLVHRSPPVRYHADGTFVNRLLLKVDLK